MVEKGREEGGGGGKGGMRSVANTLLQRWYFLLNFFKIAAQTPTKLLRHIKVAAGRETDEAPSPPPQCCLLLLFLQKHVSAQRGQQRRRLRGGGEGG